MFVCCSVTKPIHPAQIDLDITEDPSKIREAMMAMDRDRAQTFLETVGFSGFRRFLSHRCVMRSWPTSIMSREVSCSATSTCTEGCRKSAVIPAVL